MELAITDHPAPPPPEQAAESALPTAEELKELANRAAYDAKQKWEALWKEGRTFVKEHPGASLLAALGAGVIIGLLSKK